MFWRNIRTFLVTPPLSAFCFSMFWLSGIVVDWFDRSKTGLHYVARFWSRLLLRTAGVRVVTEGLERIPKDGHYVYVSNHLSLADTPIMCACLPTRFRFLAKESLMKIPIIGGHLRRGGHIAVTREDARGAARSLAEAAGVLKKKLASILIFAEGTRSVGELRSFKGGAAHLAIKCQVPVVPVALTGTGEVLPRRAVFLRPGHIRLVIGEPIPTAGLTAQDRDAFTERLQEAVAGLRMRAMQSAG